MPPGSIHRLNEYVVPITKENIAFGLSQSDTRQLDFMFYGLSTSGQGAVSFQDFFLLEIKMTEYSLVDSGS